MSGLQAYQRAFQARVLSLEHGVEASLLGNKNDDFPARLDAYVLGYRARLVEALAVTYPVLKVMLGEDEFDCHMREFIDRTPSVYYSVRYYGAALPAHLRILHPGESGRTLAELASWEWTLAAVFDAPNDAPVACASLIALRSDAWPTLSFGLRASVRRVRTRTNAITWWRAAQGLCERPPQLADRSPVQWLLWRQGMTPRFRSLDALEAQLLDAGDRGADFGALCAIIAESEDSAEAAVRAAGLLRNWVAEELIAGFSTDSAPE
jgi:putative DNA-binding protein